MAAIIFIITKVNHEDATDNMIDDKQTNQCDFYRQPGAAETITQPQPCTKGNCQNGQGGDEEKKLALHNLKSFACRVIFCHRMMYK